MNNTTKPDLSRLAVEKMADEVEAAFSPDVWDMDEVAATLRALLDAKEAAERECERLRWEWSESCDERDEARASTAAAWEAGFEAGDKHGRDGTSTNPAPSATEALRRVKEAVWDEGREASASVINRGGLYTIKERTDAIDALTNPYAAKEAAHG